MDWANVRKIHTPPSAKRYSPPPPDEHALYKYNLRHREYILAPRGRAPFGAVQKTGDKRAGNGRTIESRRSCRKSLLASHSVMEMCCSCFITTKYKCLRCELPTCNKCSVFKQNEDVEGQTAGKSVACGEVSDMDLKF